MTTLTAALADHLGTMANAAETRGEHQAAAGARDYVDQLKSGDLTPEQFAATSPALAGIVARVSAKLSTPKEPQKMPPTTPAVTRPASHDPRTQAAHEWDTDVSVRAGYSSRENYVAIRSRELTGQHRTYAAPTAAPASLASDEAIAARARAMWAEGKGDGFVSEGALRDHLRKQATLAAAQSAAQARPTYGKTVTQTYAEWKKASGTPDRMTESQADAQALAEWQEKPAAERYAYPGGYASFRTRRRNELIGTARVNVAG